MNRQHVRTACFVISLGAALVLPESRARLAAAGTRVRRVFIDGHAIDVR